MSLKLENISKQYGDRRVIDHLNCTFPERGVCVLCGKSGCGKTTLLRLIAGLEQPDSGSIVGQTPIAVSFQEYRLFPQLTALQNVVALCDRPADMADAARKLLARLGFADTQMELMPAELSGGMKQRVSLCRALISQVPMILLDEPLRELDETLRSVVVAMVREKAENALIILTAHEMGELETLHPQVLNM